MDAPDKLRQKEKTDKELDQLVYQFYSLTEEEIKIVEGLMEVNNLILPSVGY